MRRWWLHLAGLCVIVGCQSTTDANRKLVLTLTTDRASLNPGDVANLTLTVTNTSSATVRIPAPGCPHFFTVVDAAGRSAGPPQLYCALILQAPIDVAPGETVTLHDTWAADSGGPGATHTLRVDAGTYTLRGMLRDNARPITSNTVAVSVRVVSLLR
jgi:hypothetical protein